MLESEELALLRPGVRQIAHPPHPSRCQIDRLAALEDRLDDVWSEQGERDHPTDVGPIDTMALGQFGNRTCPAIRDLGKPGASLCNGRDQFRVEPKISRK